MGRPELVGRIDRVEAELRALEAEVAEIRQLAMGAPPAATPVAAVPPADTAAAAGLIRQAWQEFQRGRQLTAVERASAALQVASMQGDEDALAEVASFARGIAPYVSAPLRGHVDVLAARAATATQARAPEEEVAPPPAMAPPRAVVPARAVAPPQQAPVGVAQAARARPSLGERVMTFATSELSGARGFALAGGVVTLLGIVFLFVLAANRGWIGPVARVSFGAAASLAVLLVGVMLRARFGRLQASLAAVGTGIAGGFATLAAATVIYAFLPTWGALLIAAAIATVGAGLAWLWGSQILAGLSLVGAAAAPALVALDDGISAAGTGFAVVVFAAALAAGAARRWLWLAAAVGAVALGQVVWLTIAANSGEAGAIAVAVAAALVLLAGSAAWQATAHSEGLDLVAGSLALVSGGLALSTLVRLSPSDRQAGVMLAVGAFVYAVGGYVAARRWRDLGWVIGAVALVLAAVSTSLLLSERSLTVALAVEAAALAVLAWRLRTPRFELVSLAYLALGAAHLLVIDIWIDRPIGDLAAFAAPGMYALAAAALTAGTLAIDSRGDGRSVGILARLEPLWDRLVAVRGSLRFWLYGAAVFLAAFATAALLSGRGLTLTWLAAAAVLGAGARSLGERRLQAAGLTLLTLAGAHGLLVEAQPDTLWLGRGLDPLLSVPSLAAFAAVSAFLAALALYRDRGIAFLGPLAGAEQALAWIGRRQSIVRSALLVAAAWSAVWAAGLLFIHAWYGPGQVVATGLWAATGAITAALAARYRSPALALTSLAPAVLAFGKATAFDWHELGGASSAVALLLAATGLMFVGFFGRYAVPAVSFRLELGSLASASIAVVSALVAIDRVAADRRVLGAAAVGVAAAVSGFAVPPFQAWRSGGSEKWLRDLATVYWALGLLTLGFAEWELVAGNHAATASLWAITAALIATAAHPLRETSFWRAGMAGAGTATLLCLVTVTLPSHLVEASAHPGTGLWALAVCVGALGWIAQLAGRSMPRARRPIALVAVALAVFGLSLGVLEIAERVSTAKIATDFQRGHTGVSALWGLLALGVFVVGLIRSERILQRTGLVLFGVALAKLFLYDLRNLSSITRALSFLVVGGLLLAAAFFVERILHGGGPHGPAGARTA